jgi:hypothetical protein
MPSQYSSINTDENISSVELQWEKKKWKKKTKKYNNILFLHIDFLTDLNPSVNPLKTLSTIYKGLSLI